jgi:hypothetical protein
LAGDLYRSPARRQCHLEVADGEVVPAIGSAMEAVVGCGVAVAVAVGAGVGVAVAVGVGVRVGVAVAVGVGVRVGVRWPWAKG